MKTILIDCLLTLVLCLIARLLLYGVAIALNTDTNSVTNFLFMWVVAHYLYKEIKSTDADEQL